MEKGKGYQHYVIKMKLKKNVRVQTVEKRLSMGEYSSLWLSRCPGGIHDNMRFFRVSRAQGLCEKGFLAMKQLCLGSVVHNFTLDLITASAGQEHVGPSIDEVESPHCFNMFPAKHEKPWPGMLKDIFEFLTSKPEIEGNENCP